MLGDIKKLSTARLNALIEEAGKERASRSDRGELYPAQPDDDGKPFQTSGNAPYFIAAIEGNLVLRFRSNFFGWISFSYDRTFASTFLKHVAKKNGLIDASVAAANPSNPIGTGRKH